MSVYEGKTLVPLNGGLTTTVYTLDDAGRPSTKNTHVQNFAIQLDTHPQELRYNYDSEGLISTYTIHGVADQVALEEPSNTVSFTWSDIAGIETSTLPATASSSGSTYTYRYDCTTLLSVTEEYFATSNSSAEVRESSVSTSGSGRAITTITTPVTLGLQGRQLVFDTFGNLTQAGDETINYEPTTEQVVNIELFENALRYRGLF